MTSKLNWWQVNIDIEASVIGLKNIDVCLGNFFLATNYCSTDVLTTVNLYLSHTIANIYNAAIIIANISMSLIEEEKRESSLRADFSRLRAGAMSALRGSA